MQKPALGHLGEAPRLQHVKKKLQGANRIVGRRRLKDRAYPVLLWLESWRDRACVIACFR